MVEIQATHFAKIKFRPEYNLSTCFEGKISRRGYNNWALLHSKSKVLIAVKIPSANEFLIDNGDLSWNYNSLVDL